MQGQKRSKHDGEQEGAVSPGTGTRVEMAVEFDGRQTKAPVDPDGHSGFVRPARAA